LDLTKEDKKEKKLQKTDSGADSAQNLTNEPVTVSSIKKQESNASYIALSLIVLTFLIIIKTFLNEKNYHYLYEKIRNKRIFR
jgi:hypothetical protein